MREDKMIVSSFSCRCMGSETLTLEGDIIEIEDGEMRLNVALTTLDMIRLSRDLLRQLMYDSHVNLTDAEKEGLRAIQALSQGLTERE